MWDDWHAIEAAQARADGKAGRKPQEAREEPDEAPAPLPLVSVLSEPFRRPVRRIPTSRVLEVLERMLASGTPAEQRIAVELAEEIRRKGADRGR